MRWSCLNPRFGRRERRWCGLVSLPLLVSRGTRAFSMASPDVTMFAETRLTASNQLLRSASSVALQDLQPILPGHAVVVPLEKVTRLCELSEDGLLDLWRTARAAEQDLQKQYGSTASNWAVFDGWSAGQPVPHVHVHVVPRKPKDLENNDEVYSALERWTPSPKDAETPPSIEWPADETRKKRTSDEMALEAQGYRMAMSGHGSFPEEQVFASHRIPPSHLFYASERGLTVALVNLKPLVPGHVLVVPRRCVPRIGDLSEEEFDDLFRSVRLVQAVLEQSHGAEASRLGLQDGQDAGQSVAHVHVHILPIPGARKGAL